MESEQTEGRTRCSQGLLSHVGSSAKVLLKDIHQHLRFNSVLSRLAVSPFAFLLHLFRKRTVQISDTDPLPFLS